MRGWVGAGCIFVCLGVQAWAQSDSERALAMIAEQENRLPGLKEKLAAAQAEHVPVFYPRADLTIAEMFCGYCRDDVANQRVARALDVAKEVKEILDRAESEMRTGVDVPVLKVGSETIKDGGFWGTCTIGGKEEFRPVFLTGYGHFGGVVEALPTLQQIGINVIQIEIGPNGVVNEDGSVHTEEIESWVVKSLDRARDHGVAVCLLISPHYFPDWAFTKWPEIRVNNGFIKNTLDAPQVRAIYEKYLRALIPMIKDHPALESICLSNEPVSVGSADDPFRLPLWRKYVMRKYGTIENLNAVYGTSYKSFDEAPHPKLGFSEKPAALYDAVRFNQERFAEWHAWMAVLIHEMAPYLPCHAKVMAMPSNRETVFWGTDPWEFAQLSQINGNDCSFAPNNETKPWESMWQTQNMYYDLERSMKSAPVFNTENHIIPDRTQAYVKPSHIYAAIWQGAIHGMGGSATWSWARTYDAKSDFEGLILHRAGCTAAMSRCALDLMRLSREVAAVQNIQPRAAILYSNAGQVFDTRASQARRRVYEALNFCGVPIGFVTDEQVAAGWLGKFDCLIVAGSSAVPNAAIQGIREYADRGGCLVVFDTDNMSTDEHGQRVPPVEVSRTIPATLEGEALRDELDDVLKQAAIEPPLVVKTPQGRAPYGVEWRCAELDGRQLVNMVNLTRDPIEVKLPDGDWTDLITRKKLEKIVKLEPNTPVLACG